jgi:hypothetical protein
MNQVLPSFCFSYFSGSVEFLPKPTLEQDHHTYGLPQSQDNRHVLIFPASWLRGALADFLSGLT